LQGTCNHHEDEDDNILNDGQTEQIIFHFIYLTSLTPSQYPIKIKEHGAFIFKYE